LLALLKTVTTVLHIKEVTVRDLTIREAADRINTTGSAMRMAIRRGRVIAYKRAGSYFVDQDEVDRWASVKRIGRPPKGEKK